MKEIFRSTLCQICRSAIFAGLIIFFIGAYYCVIKAGIPYQDPPLQLQIKYAINMGIGDILINVGFIVALCGGIFRLILWLIFKRFFQKDRPEPNSKS